MRAGVSAGLAAAATGAGAIIKGARIGAEGCGSGTFSEEVGDAGMSAVACITTEAASSETRVTSSAGEFCVSSRGVVAPQVGQKRLFGVRTAWQLGQVRGMRGLRHKPYHIWEYFQHRLQKYRNSARRWHGVCRYAYHNENATPSTPAHDGSAADPRSQVTYLRPKHH